MPKATKSIKKTAVRTAKKVATKAVQSRVKAAQTQVKAVGKKADLLAKKNPWALAGISAGLGLAVGILSTRKGKGGKKKK